MPEVKKAELIKGVVYMPSPVRLTQHAAPDNLLQTWLGVYAARTPGLQAAANATTRLGPEDVPQPDALLRILPEHGGRTRIDAKGYLEGGPELVVEIAAGSASIDAGDKHRSYRRTGVLEYLLWRTEDRAVDWWKLENDEYQGLEPDRADVLRSQVFPGLWLNVPARLAHDAPGVLDTLDRGLKDASHKAFIATLGR